ncbi:hypothetical protein AAON49_06930 [Pseudotenacibaculum sp. MALMAid0570]|uniref:hypothetical protein n=1 Tax=Pseudotenacibaculum sp. MALMAid0570 TaxID=3143938 RepID=UPI0032E0407F
MKKLFVLLILVLFVPILFIPFYTDANVFAYMGRLLVNGYVPYVDGWDHKGVSLYLINAFGYAIGFKSMIGIKIVELLLILYTFIRIFDFLKKEYSWLIAFIAASFGLFTLKYFFDGGNLTEEYGALFSLLSISLILKEKAKTLDYALVGAFFIINFTLRANLIAFWVALFCAYLAQLILKKESFKVILMQFVKMSYGAIAIISLLLVYLLSTNSLDEFIDAAFTFNFSYSGASKTSVFSTIFSVVKKYHLSVIFIIGFIISLLRFIKDKRRKLELILIFWIPIELFFGNISDRLYAHYYMMWIPLVIFSTAVIIAEIRERLQITNTLVVILMGVIFAGSFYVPSYMTLKNWKWILLEADETKIVGDYVSENYKDDTLLVWGNSTDIYNQTDKFSPTTFFYHSTFKYDTEYIRKKIEEFHQQVSKNKPSLIIDGKRSGMLQLDGSNSLEIDEGQKRNLKEFLKIVKTNYVLKEQKFGLDFYVLKSNE